MRHRISYVHTAEHPAPIKEANATYVELAPDLRVAREDKYTLDVAPCSHIQTLRIQVARPMGATLNSTGLAQNANVFAYSHQVGVHVYAVPSTVVGVDEKAAFHAQLDAVLELVLGIRVPADEWVLALNSFYFYSAEPRAPTLALLLQFPTAWDAWEYYHTGTQLVVSALCADLRALAVAADGHAYTEVGVFHVLPHATRDDVVLSGARVVMDGSTEKQVHKTLFHVKPRHRRLPHASFSVAQNGLHPIFHMDAFPEPPQDDDVLMCRMYCYLTLAKSVFLDPYQVPASFEVLANYGERSLELPAYAVPQWGNEILAEIDALSIALPLHSRYQLPDAERSHTNVTIANPVLFYACDVTSDAQLLENSPFDTRRDIGSYEKFFTRDTVFYDFLARGSTEIQIPNAQGTPAHVYGATTIALVLGLYLVLLLVYRKWALQRVSPAKKHV